MTLLSRSNLTRLFDWLKSAGLVERTRAKADRRGAYAVVTRKGRDMRRKIWPVYSAAIKDLFAAHIDNNEASVIAAVAQRVLNAARE